MRLKIRERKQRLRRNLVQRAHKRDKRNKSRRAKRKEVTLETDLIPHQTPVRQEASPKDL